jgi:hypothetical protein
VFGWKRKGDHVPPEMRQKLADAWTATIAEIAETIARAEGCLAEPEASQLENERRADLLSRIARLQSYKKCLTEQVGKFRDGPLFLKELGTEAEVTHREIVETDACVRDIYLDYALDGMTRAVTDRTHDQ